VKYLQAINSLQLTIAEKTEFKNLGRATPDFVIYQSSSNRIKTYVRKCNLAIYTKTQVVEWLC
jgi:hypothetical protein